MSERLIIKSFGPIKEANLDLKRYMVLIGTQASGKSTVAKLLAIFRDIEFIIDEESDRKKYFDNYSIGSYFSNSSEFTYTNNNYEINYKDNKWDVKKTPEFSKQIEAEIGRINDLLRTTVEANERLKQQSKEEKDKYFKQLYSINWKNLFLVLSKPIYIPAERILLSIIEQAPFTLRNVALPYCLTEFGSRFDFAKNAITEFDINFLNIKYKNEQGKNKIYIDETHSIPLAESASGYQTTIPMILVIENLNRRENNYSFIVEEPELNLFPSTQKSIINYLVGQSNIKNATNALVITTHSPYILTVLNSLLYAGIVANKAPNKIERIKEIVPEQNWINRADFNAYYFRDGHIKEIFDSKIGLISANELDDISEDLQGENDELMELYNTAT